MADTHHFEEEEFKGTFTGQVALRILAQVKPYSTWVIGFVLTIGLVSFLDSYFTYLHKRIVDEGIGLGDFSALKDILLQYGALLVVQAIAVFVFIYFAGVLGERVQYDLRKKMFSQLQKLSLSYYNKTPVGWIMSRVSSDSERVAQLITWGFLDLVWGILKRGAGRPTARWLRRHLRAQVCAPHGSATGGARRLSAQRPSLAAVRVIHADRKRQLSVLRPTPGRDPSGDVRARDRLGRPSLVERGRRFRF